MRLRCALVRSTIPVIVPTTTTALPTILAPPTIPTMSTTPNDEKFDYPASPVVDELKHSDLSHADEGYQTYVTTADTVPVDEEESKRIARMLDWRLLPLSTSFNLCGRRGKG